MVIYMYYVLIEAWCLGYAVNYATGDLMLGSGGTVDELVSKRFRERAVRFDANDGLDDASLAGLPAATSVRHDDEAVLLYSSDVAATVGGLLELTAARGVEPENLGIRRATLEDVFLDLTGREYRA